MTKLLFSFGRPETDCGYGSKLAFTEQLRVELPLLLQELKVGTLLDAPCGDFNWLAQTNLSGIHYYIGCDYDPEHCETARRKAAESPVALRPHSMTVLERDVITDELPPSDLLLCRDFLQHLPTDLALAALRNLLASRPEWLLATSHDNVTNLDIESTGMFRPLNLEAPPFSLPPPSRTLQDGGRILGLWRGRQCSSETPTPPSS